MLSQTVEFVDEPINHLDMESIESLNTGLEKFPGTLVFISHDREFVSSRSRAMARSSITLAVTKTTSPVKASPKSHFRLFLGVDHKNAEGSRLWHSCAGFTAFFLFRIQSPGSLPGSAD